MDYWGELPMMIATSAEKKQGKDEILSYIEDNMQYFIPPPKGAKTEPEEEDEYEDSI